MNYEIILYDARVVPLHRAVCKIVFTEDRTRNSVGVILHSHEQVKALIEQLKTYTTPPPSWGMPEKELDRMSHDGDNA